MSMKCKYCGVHMDDPLYPYYCDYNQGRCPHIKKPPPPKWLVRTILAVLALYVIIVIGFVN